MSMRAQAVLLDPESGKPVSEREALRIPRLRGDLEMLDEADGRHDDVLARLRARRKLLTSAGIEEIKARAGSGIRLREGSTGGSALIERFQREQEHESVVEHRQRLREQALTLKENGYDNWADWFCDQMEVSGCLDGQYGAIQGATTTGTALKTLIQLTAPATGRCVVLEWWVTFNASAAATPIDIDLTNDTAITGGTAGTAPTVFKLWGDWPLAALVTAQTYTAEPTRTGPLTIFRSYVPPTSGDGRQYPLSRELHIGANMHIALRTTAPAAVNATCGFYWEG